LRGRDRPGSPTTVRRSFVPFKDAGQKVLRQVKKLGSLLPSHRTAARDEQRVVRPWREDSFHAYPSVGLTPARVLALLHTADAGSPQMQFELFAEMLQKWPRLAAVEATRRLALTGLDWEIAPGDSSGQGQAAAEYCRTTLAALERFHDVLDHLANAIGYGIAVAELVWDSGRLIDVVPVPYSRLISDVNEPWRLRVRTEEDPSVGVALDESPAKWVVHQPRPKPGRHFEGGLLRASALLYLAQNLSFKDWLIYSQIAGMPVRVGRFEPGTPESDKQQLLKMLEALGTDAVAIISKNVELQLLEARGGDKPYQPLQEYCNNEVTILWLGQHLTTDLRGEGSRAAAEIHDRVREDLLVDDIADESQTIRRDLLTPLVRARFGDAVAVPEFRRSLIQSVDTKVLADTLAVAVRELGMKVPRRWVHRALGIPEPSGEEPVLLGGSEP
jgi:phage gp29-like protein